jgi:tetratricopeptide (TPR) repeat protein
MRKLNMKAQTLRITISLFLFCLFWLVSAVAAQNRSTVSGFVFDQQRRPVSQIQVELLTDFNNSLARTKTDGSGRFFFTGLSQGRFVVKVLSVGTDYEEQTQSFEVYGINAAGRPISDNVQKDFYLRLRRDGNGRSEIKGTTFAQEIPDEARKSYEKAIADIEAKRVEEAISGLENSIKLFPTYYLALEKLGGLYISQQKFDNARDVFKRTVAVNERSFYGWYGLSYSNYALKQSEPAIEAGRKAVTLNANSADAHLILGISLRQAKQYQEAEKSLKQAEKSAQGKSPDVHWNLALLYGHNLNRYADAADQLEFYLKANPSNPNTEGVKKLIKQFREKSVSAKG